MSNLSFLALLRLRVFVRQILGLFGAIGLIGGGVCLLLGLNSGSLSLLLYGAAGVGLWFGVYALAWHYDQAIFRRQPPGYRISLDQ